MKLNLDRFKAMQLTSEECKNIVCGEPAPPPGGGGTPVSVVIPGGGTPDNPITCYYNFDGELMYCKDKFGKIVSTT